MTGSPLPTHSDILALTTYLPRLYAKDLTLVNWSNNVPEYAPMVKEFFLLASQPCWSDYHYNPKVAGKLLQDAEHIRTCNLAEIKTLLTYCVRGERFSTGHWVKVIQGGYLRRILERLKVLAEEMAPQQIPSVQQDVDREKRIKKYNRKNLVFLILFSIACIALSIIIAYPRFMFDLEEARTVITLDSFMRAAQAKNVEEAQSFFKHQYIDIDPAEIAGFIEGESYAYFEKYQSLETYGSDITTPIIRLSPTVPKWKAEVIYTVNYENGGKLYLHSKLVRWDKEWKIMSFYFYTNLSDINSAIYSSRAE